MLAPNDVVPGVVRHLVRADEIAPADLGGIEAEAGGALVHQPLADEIALGPPGRPERARRRLVGDHRPEIAVVVGHAIRAGEERGAELGRHERGGAHVRADVRAHQRTQPDDAPLRVEADLGLVLDLARVVGGHHGLAALLDPPDGAAELHRGERDQHVFGIQLAADAEAPAHVHLRQAQGADGDAEDRGEDGAVDVDALGGADQVQLAPARVGGNGDEAARLERRRRLARIGEALADDHGGRVERPVDVADAHRDHRDVVGLGAGKEPRRAGGERIGHRGAGGEGIVDDVDALERVLGHVAIVGHDQRDGLAHVADHAAGDGGLQVPLGSRRGAHAVRDHCGLGHVGGGEDEPHTRQVEGPLGVDRDQPRVRMGRAQHGGVQHALHADVGHEAAGARVRGGRPRCDSANPRSSMLLLAGARGARGTVIARRRAEGKRGPILGQRRSRGERTWQT